MAKEREHSSLDDERVLVAAVDQGTSSTRFVAFDAETGLIVAQHQIEMTHVLPQHGWVEQDPVIMLQNTRTCIDAVTYDIEMQGISRSCIKGIGIANQRETTIVWDRYTGKPLHNAIVWLDTRTNSTVEHLVSSSGGDKDTLKPMCGLPIASYFSAVKLRWLMDNVPVVAGAISEGTAMFGTVDSWLIWNLTGGVHKGVHITDVTNASRTMLMNLHSTQWDDDLLSFFSVPRDVLPDIRSSSEIYGHIFDGALVGLPLCGCLGDQQAALVGQGCFSEGDAKNTYGTGCFLLCNTGTKPVPSRHGLLTTVGYQLGPHSPTVYALEGSVATAGAAVRWLRDGLGMISSPSEMEELASSVPDTAGVYFVPAFSGLYAPHWRSDARGTIVGLTQYTTKSHIALATLEAICFQTRELLDAMNLDCALPLTKLRVDGGMTGNTKLMQLQADLLGIPVLRPRMSETTVLGAAIAAGLAVGVWIDDRNVNMKLDLDQFQPLSTHSNRNERFTRWGLAVERSLGWATTDTAQKTETFFTNSASAGMKNSVVSLKSILRARPHSALGYVGAFMTGLTVAALVFTRSNGRNV